MMLLDRDLNMLLKGRRTFGNIMKYIMMDTSSNFGYMFSMAGVALFLPFLSMLPTQILLNNIPCYLSEVPIPFDDVNQVELRKPRVMDMNFIRNFLLVLGSISSLFDFLIFYVMLVVSKANEGLFQTGWFVEFLCTQVLAIFIFHTRGNPFKSRAHPILVVISITVVSVAAAVAITHVGTYFGFVPHPTNFIPSYRQ